jgi:hypothetical protein
LPHRPSGSRRARRPSRMLPTSARRLEQARRSASDGSFEPGCRAVS